MAKKAGKGDEVFQGCKKNLESEHRATQREDKNWVARGGGAGGIGNKGQDATHIRLDLPNLAFPLPERTWDSSPDPGPEDNFLDLTQDPPLQGRLMRLTICFCPLQSHP